MTDRTLVPIHVQTTDDEADAAIRAVGVALPSTCRLFAVAADAETAPSLDTGLGEAASTPVRCSVHADERALLAALSRFGHDRVVQTAPLLVTDGGDPRPDDPACWTFRNRAARLDPACPFVGLPYVDLAPIVDDRSGPGRGSDALSDAGRLDGALPPARSECDRPIECPTEALLARTLAALVRTDALATLARDADGRHEGRSKRPRGSDVSRQAPSDDRPRLAPTDDPPRLAPSEGAPRLAPTDDPPRLAPSEEARRGSPSDDTSPSKRPDDASRSRRSSDVPGPR